MYTQIVQNLPPTPSKFHYIFNLRDLSRVYQGLCLTVPDRFETAQQFVRVWKNECLRVFHDRLTNAGDKAAVQVSSNPMVTALTQMVVSLYLLANLFGLSEWLQVFGSACCILNIKFRSPICKHLKRPVSSIVRFRCVNMEYLFGNLWLSDEVQASPRRPSGRIWALNYTLFRATSRNCLKRSSLRIWSLCNENQSCLEIIATLWRENLAFMKMSSITKLRKPCLKRWAMNSTLRLSAAMCSF